MPEHHELAAAPQDESWARIERIVECFEDAWRQGNQPALSDYLPDGSDLLPGLLVELIHAELELRLQAGEAARVEEYLTRYPELADERQVVLALLQIEWRMRARLDPQLSADEYQQRFPALAQELTKVLSTVSLEPQRGLPTTLDTLAKDPNATTGTELPRIPGYEIEKELGRGGMGVVWKAKQLTLDRVVALKMILDDQHAGEEVLARFQREARVLARLQHPNIVQIHEVGTQAGRPFFSLEFVDGGSLDKKLQGKPCAIRQSARLVETLARAVQAAHEAGIVHRDLKPANVLVAKGWVLKITDFGLAKRLDEVGKTQTGAIMGTPSYMAPEQAAGKVREVGPASDIYALGAILYELLTGRPPFLAPTTWETIQKVLTEEPISLRRLRREIPHDLETICLIMSGQGTGAALSFGPGIG